MLIKVGYYFVANVVLFLAYENKEIVVLHLNGPASVYAAAGLFSSASTLVMFLLMSFFESTDSRSLRRFLADILLTVLASILPLLVLQIASLLLAPRIALGLPVLSKLLTASSFTVPTIWIGWLAVTFLRFALKNSTGISTEGSESNQLPDTNNTINTSSTISTSSKSDAFSTLKADKSPRWVRLYDFASFQLEEGNYQAAMPLLIEVMVILEAEQNVEPHLIMTLSAELGDCLANSADYTAAKEYYERALIILHSMPAGDGRKFAELVAKLRICYQKTIGNPD